MYDCPFTNWNAAKMGPRRDTVAELGAAVRATGLKFGVSSHRAFNWRYYTFREAFDTNSPDLHKLYGVPHPDDAPVSYEFILDWYARTRDLVDRFSPDVLWFDFGWHRDEFEPWRPRVAAYYYNHALSHGYEPVLQYKDGFPDGVAVLDIERGKLDHLRQEYWQTDTSVSYKSWSYITDDEFRTATSIVHDLVDIVSKNGNLLLNIGPRSNGTIPQEVEDILLGLGQWLAGQWRGHLRYSPLEHVRRGSDGGLHGSVRGTGGQAVHRPGHPLHDQGQRPLRDLPRLAAEGFDNPVARQAGRTGLGRRGVSLLGSDEPLVWSQDVDGLRIEAPPHVPREHAYVFRISFVDGGRGNSV